MTAFSDAFQFDDVDAHVRNCLSHIVNRDVVGNIANIKFSRQVSSTEGNESIDDLLPDDDVGRFAQGFFLCLLFSFIIASAFERRSIFLQGRNRRLRHRGRSQMSI